MGAGLAWAKEKGAVAQTDAIITAAKVFLLRREQ
jgi:hypothetical protein